MKKKTVLVVDDSEIVVAMASDALEEGGFTVITAPNAKAADKYIHSERKPDLIILDVMLPILDGDKKAKMLKDNPQTKSIPILLLSSKPADELARLVTDSGADGFIRKPFIARNMVDKVREMLS
ncbi:response receiver [Geotalea daltonii FRC-32]|uniref:Response receiver n=1 Tax=Geotalea daltonii (strain DSM 22248 / JCM 15807 / FRC-32) TaxID=316067 RepID=B9M6A8_GEODF|nr:response regulator [Geotalea daltonii]ACM21896.1 response receiver [Geotalea daltonii FRC-32]